MPQRDVDNLKAMTPEEVVKAYNLGEFDQLMGRGEFYKMPPRQPQTDQDWADALGITLDELAHIERPDVRAKINANLTAADTTKQTY